MRVTRRTQWSVAAVSLLSLALVSGCSSSSEEAAQDTQNANAALCSSLTGLRSQIQEVAAAGTSAAASGQGITVGQAQTALAQIQDSWQSVKGDVSGVSQAAATQFDQAQAEYQESLSQIDSGDSLASAQGQVASAQRELASSYEAVVTGLGC